MTNFNKYNRTFTPEELSKMAYEKNRIINGSNKFSYPEPPAGRYLAQVAMMKIVEKSGQLVFKLHFSLLEGLDEDTEAFMNSWPGKGTPKIPYTRPITNTNADGACLGSVLGMLNRFLETTTIDFEDYTTLAETVESIYGTIKEHYAYEVEYHPKKFDRFIIHSIFKDEVEDSQEVPETEDTPEPPEAPIPDDDTPKMVTPRMVQMSSSYPGEASEEDDDDGFVPVDEEEDDLPF